MAELVIFLGWVFLIIISCILCYILIDTLKGGYRALDFTVCYIWASLKLRKYSHKYIFVFIKLFFSSWKDFLFGDIPDEIYASQWDWSPGWNMRIVIDGKYYYFKKSN